MTRAAITADLFILIAPCRATPSTGQQRPVTRGLCVDPAGQYDGSVRDVRACLALGATQPGLARGHRAQLMLAPATGGTLRLPWRSMPLLVLLESCIRNSRCLDCAPGDNSRGIRESWS